MKQVNENKSSLPKKTKTLTKMMNEIKSQSEHKSYEELIKEYPMQKSHVKEWLKSMKK